MNEITARLLQSLVYIGLFTLIVAVAIGVMKFLGKYLVKLGTIALIATPVIGIIGGWIEWIITGNDKAPIAMNLLNFSFGSALVLYALAFFAFLFFNWEDKDANVKQRI